MVEVRDDSGNRFGACHSTRPLDSLNWELNLLEFLTEHDFLVPTVVPTVDGRRHADSVVVQT